MESINLKYSKTNVFDNQPTNNENLIIKKFNFKKKFTKFDSNSYLMKINNFFKVRFFIYCENKKIYKQDYFKILKFELKNNEKVLDCTGGSIEENEDYYVLKFNLKLENEERNRILSTLNIKIGDEIIGSCEIVIVRNKEEVEKEIKDCELIIKSSKIITR
jgi:hypothetical protein